MFLLSYSFMVNEVNALMATFSEQTSFSGAFSVLLCQCTVALGSLQIYLLLRIFAQSCLLYHLPF